MTKIAILPVTADHGQITYWAMARDKRSEGATAGAALDALTAQLNDDEAGTMIVVQSEKPDRYFDAAHQERLIELMACWREYGAEGKSLPAAESAELEQLMQAELRASALRASDLADELKR